MRLKKNIQETLKRNLFIAPNPPQNRSEYMALRDEIFPDKNLFLEFLDEENYEKQLHLANEILLRLNYDMLFAPPTRLLFNLLNMEMQPASQDKNSCYFGRDHVIHQVHLYMFGIYVFFYHEIFEINIISAFRNQRRNKKSFNAKTNTVIKDFIVAWRAFVLYHDLGYPIELYVKKRGLVSEANKENKAEKNNEGNNDNKEKKEQSPAEDYLAAFQQIPKFIGKDLSMCCISKIIAVSKLIEGSREEESNDENDSNKESRNDYRFVDLNSIELKGCTVISGISKRKEMPKIPEEEERINESALKKLLSDYSNYVLIDKVYGIDTVRTITSIYGKENLFAVLGNKEGMLYLIYLPDGQIICTDNCPKGKVVKELRNNVNAPFERNSFLYPNLHWQYYINKKKINIKSIINILFDLKPNKRLKDSKSLKSSWGDAFDTIVKTVYEKTSANYAMVISDNSFKQYCFEVYLALYNTIGYNKLNRDDLRNSYIYHLDEQVDKLKTDIPDEIAKAIKKCFKDQNSDYLDKDLDTIVTEFLKSVEHFADKIITDMKESINANLEKQCRFKAYFETLRYFMGEKIKNSGISCGVSFKEKAGKTDYSLFEYPIINESDNDLIEGIKKKLKLSKLLLEDDVAKYHPKHSGYDHGVCGGILASAIVDIYCKFYTFSNENSGKKEYPFKQILNISLGLDYDLNKKNIEFMLQNTLVEAFYAILIHNIYPSAFSGHEEFRTKLETTPFAYFATLMDCLQFWDRKININQAINDLPYATYSKSLNIEVKDNKIRITEADRRLDIARAVRDRKDVLDEFLENASNYIELGLSEY